MKTIINILHFLFYFLVLISPFIDDCVVKINVYIMLLFILFHFISKYGKCGIINIERFFLKENFKNGFFYNLIKPVIDYRKNIFFDKLFHLLIIYIFILTFQIYKNNCLSFYYNEFKKALKILTSKIMY